MVFLGLGLNMLPGLLSDDWDRLGPFVDHSTIGLYVADPH